MHNNNNGTSSYDLLNIFDELFADFESVFNSPEVVRCGEVFHTSNFPPVNIYMDEISKDLTYEYAVAGYNKDDIEVDFDGDKMIIEIKSPKSTKSESLKILKKGIKTAGVKSTTPIPVSKYNTGDSKAEMKDGILTIFVPAREEIKPKKIIIN